MLFALVSVKKNVIEVLKTNVMQLLLTVIFLCNTLLLKRVNKLNKKTKAIRCKEIRGDREHQHFAHQRLIKHVHRIQGRR